MTKKLLLLAVSLVMITGMSAQTIQDTVMKVGDLMVPAYYVTMTQDNKTVNQVLQKKLKDSGLKTTKSSDGYLAVLGQTFTEVATVPINMYMEMTERGRRDNKVTVFMVCAMAANTGEEASVVDTYVRRFAETVYKSVTRFEAEEKLEAEEKNLKKAQKEYDKAVSELNKIDKNIESDNKKKDKIEKEMAKLEEKMKKCKDQLDDLEKSLDKYNDKRTNAEQRVKTAEETLNTKEAEVERYRKALE